MDQLVRIIYGTVERVLDGNVHDHEKKAPVSGPQPEDSWVLLFRDWIRGFDHTAAAEDSVPEETDDGIMGETASR